MVAPAARSSQMMELLGRCRVEPIVLDEFHPDLCPALEQIILQRMQASGGRRIGSLNVGGWKSGEDFFAWSDAAVQELRQRIVEELGMPRPVGWAMVNRAGSHHPRHQHRAAVLSGIYFVTAGSEDAITPTIFECGGDAKRKVPSYPLEIEPHPGRVIIARGEAWHSVPRYPGELPRITIAFDVRR